MGSVCVLVFIFFFLVGLITLFTWVVDLATGFFRHLKEEKDRRVWLSEARQGRTMHTHTMPTMGKIGFESAIPGIALWDIGGMATRVKLACTKKDLLYHT